MSDDSSCGIRSDFLRQCVAYQAEIQGAQPVGYIPGRTHEHVSYGWSPELKHGMPDYDTRSWTWEFYGDGTCEFNLMVDLLASGGIRIRPGDDDGSFLNLRLRNPLEIGEVLDLVEQLSPENCQSCEHQEIPWSAIIDSLYVLLPGDEKPKLARFAWSDWLKGNPELLVPFKAFYMGEYDLLVDAGFSTWEDWLKTDKRMEALPPVSELQEDDLVIGPDTGFHGAREVSMGTEIQPQAQPVLVVRLKPGQSRMYFVDFAEHMSEGGVLCAAFREDLARLEDLITSGKIRYPSTRLSQIRRAVELRVVKNELEDEVQRLLGAREPMEQILERFQHRIRDVKSLT